MDTKKLEIENLENLSEIEVLTEDELDSVVGGGEVLATLTGVDAVTINISDFA